MLYKIYRSTVVLIVPMFFVNISPMYERYVWIPFFIMLFMLLRASIVSPMNELSAGPQALLTVLAAAAVALLAKFFLALVASEPPVFALSLSSVYTRIGMGACLRVYPHMGDFKLEDIFSSKDGKKTKRIHPPGRRLLYAGLIALGGGAIHYTDPFSLAGGLRGDGALPSIFVLSVCSFALTRVFYRLESKTAAKSDKDTALYNTWLGLPAFALSGAILVLAYLDD